MCAGPLYHTVLFRERSLDMRTIKLVGLYEGSSLQEQTCHAGSSMEQPASSGAGWEKWV